MLYYALKLRSNHFGGTKVVAFKHLGFEIQRKMLVNYLSQKSVHKNARWRELHFYRHVKVINYFLDKDIFVLTFKFGLKKIEFYQSCYIYDEKIFITLIDKLNERLKAYKKKALPVTIEDKTLLKLKKKYASKNKKRKKNNGIIYEKDYWPM